MADLYTIYIDIYILMFQATNDVRLRDKAIENILLNPETIAVNQVLRVHTSCVLCAYPAS